MMKNFDIMEAHWKIRILEGVHEKTTFGGGGVRGWITKKEGLDSLQI